MSNENDDQATVAGAPTIAPVLDFQAAAERYADRHAANLLDDEDMEDEPTLEDLAFMAKRLILTFIKTLDFPQLAGLTQGMLDDGDIAVVRQFLAQAKVTVEVPDVVGL